MSVGGDRTDVPTVSVCIRAFRRPAGLRNAIESALAQSFRDFEVVVSDDSGDLEPVAQAARDPRVSYHRNPRPAGQVANIVTSFGLARGRLLALLDDDDRWLPGFLETVVEHFERDPELGIIFTDVYFEAGGRRVRRRAPVVGGRHESFLCQILEHWPIAPSAAVMRRAVWEEGERDFPLQDFAIGDVTMWIRAALAGWPFRYLDEPLVVRGLDAGQLSWSEGIPARAIATHERFRFDDPACERLRCAWLAEARLAQAGAHLWHGRVRLARREISQARELASGRFGVRGWLAVTGLRPHLVRLAAARPALLMTAVRLWRRMRPPVAADWRDPGTLPVRHRRRFNRLVGGVEGWLGLREARALHEAAYRLGRRTPALVAVEIGSWKGRSTTAIASGLARAGRGVLHAIDPHQGTRTHALTGEPSTYGAFRRNLKLANLERYVRPVRATSAEARPSFPPGSVGLLFIDGSHHYEDVVRDIDDWFPCLSDGATVAFHDAAGYEGVCRALQARVLCAGSGFESPRLVQQTLFVRRIRQERTTSRTRWSLRRGRFLLWRRRVYSRCAVLLAPLRRLSGPGPSGWITDPSVCPSGRR
jgi:hypothetical protein